MQSAREDLNLDALRQRLSSSRLGRLFQDAFNSLKKLGITNFLIVGKTYSGIDYRTVILRANLKLSLLKQAIREFLGG